jgi:hypothetical protein
MNQWDHIKVATGIIEASAREAILAADSLEDKFRAAFREANQYFMSTDDDVRFKGGIGAVMLSVGIDAPEWQRIKIELDQLKILGAMMTGVPVNFEDIPPLPDDFNPIGITTLWKEITQ